MAKKTDYLNKTIPGIIGGIIAGLAVFLLSMIVFGSYNKNNTKETSSPVLEVNASPTPSPSPSAIPSPSFSPVPLVSIPKDNLQERKDAFAVKAKEFTERAKAEGKSNTAIANTIRLMYQIEFGENSNSQQDYSSCLIQYNTRLSEYNACMLGGNLTCLKPMNTCTKPLGAGF